MNAPIKALGAMLLASAVNRAKANIARTDMTREEVAADHQAIREAAEIKFQEGFREWEQKQALRIANRQSLIDRLKNDLQSEYQKDKDDERNGDWTR